LTQLW